MKDGYYWCKISENVPWAIQKIKRGYVVFSDIAMSYPMELLYDIGDYIETPEKYKAELEADK